MPIPKPNRGESQDDYISRCISFAAGEGTPGNQAAAICHDTWRRSKKEDAGIFKGIFLKLFGRRESDGRA